MNTVITIGREFGSGGRELGTRLANELGFAYYDKEIVAEIAQRTELSEQYIKNIMEHRPIIDYPLHFGVTINGFNSPQIQINNSVYTEQHKIIKEYAKKSDCVIVGRCADYILRELNPVRIFVYCDMESKIQRCRARGDDSSDKTDKQMKKYIDDINKGRRLYYEYYTDLRWGDRINYDLCINTTGLSIKDIVPGLAEIVKSISE